MNIDLQVGASIGDFKVVKIDNLKEYRSKLSWETDLNPFQLTSQIIYFPK